MIVRISTSNGNFTCSVHDSGDGELAHDHMAGLARHVASGVQVGEAFDITVEDEAGLHSASLKGQVSSGLQQKLMQLYNTVQAMRGVTTVRKAGEADDGR